MQRLLDRLLLHSPMMNAQDRQFGGALLIIAGLFQFTPLKRICPRYCRAPAEFLTQHWRSGVAGGFQLGWKHGLYCLGCCWALMLAALCGRRDESLVVAGLTTFVQLEKLAPFGQQGGRWSGPPIFALGLWFFR